MSEAQKDIQILLLRQQVRVLQHKARQPKRFSRFEKTLLAVLVARMKRLTAHFGHWFRPPRARTDHWQPSDHLLYGQLGKRKNHRRVTFTHTRMLWGQRRALFACLRQVGLRPLIQTAFVERVNLTFRQSVSPLSRRTWAYAQTKRHLLLHCEWFRLYYHLVRAHESLAIEVPGLKWRCRSRSPAMVLGLTTHLWCVHDLLHYPVPRVA